MRTEESVECVRVRVTEEGLTRECVEEEEERVRGKERGG